MNKKPTVKVEYIEVKSIGSAVGNVVWEHDFHMLLDANGYVPRQMEEVKPPGSRTVYRVVKVRREFLKTKTKIKVIMVKAGR